MSPQIQYKKPQPVSSASEMKFTTRSESASFSIWVAIACESLANVWVDMRGDCIPCAVDSANFCWAYFTIWSQAEALLRGKYEDEESKLGEQEIMMKRDERIQLRKVRMD